MLYRSAPAASRHKVLVAPDSRPRGWLAGIALAVLALVGAAGWWGVSAPSGLSATAIGPSSRGVAAPDPPAAPATGVASLQGTQPDGAIHAGDGELRLGADLIRRFDYWLTALGEKPLRAVRADIQADLARELRAAGLQRALRLLDAYVAYKTELSRLTPESTGQMDAAALGRQVQAIRGVRARHFSPDEVATLFGVADAEEDHAIARLRIAQDPALSDASRRQKLRQLRQQLTPEQRAAESEPVLHLAVADAVAQARARGADASEIRLIRTQMVGVEAAERLARLDAERAAWQSRVEVYLSLRQSQPAEAAAHKATQFSPAEQLRLGAFE